jgi:putative aldouronate transport system substrate-binding protein
MTEMSRRTALRSVFGAGLAAAVLSACGSGESSGGPAGAAKVELPKYVPYAGVTPEFPALPNGTVAGFTTYPASPKALTTGVPGDGKPITAIAQLNGPLPPTLEGNAFWQEVNKRIGSPMQIQLVNAGPDFIAKIATIQASDQLPDLMQLNTSVPSLAEFLQAKMLDLGPYLSGERIREYPFLANIPADFWKGCVHNGRLMGVPIPRGAASSRVMFYRSDFLDKLGIKVEVTSYQAFSDLLSEVNDAKANRWALGANPLEYIRQMYSIPNNFERAGNGSFTSTYEHASQKDALEAARKLQAAGVINPDMGAAAQPQRAQWFLSGTGIFNWSTYTGWPPAQDIAATPGISIEILQVPGFDGGRGRGWTGSLNNNMVSIPVSAKDRVTTLLKVINWLAAPFGSAEYLFTHFGVEGIHYTLEGGTPKPDPDKSKEVPIGLGYLGAGPFVLFGTQPDFVKTVHTHMSTFMDNVSQDPTNIYYSPTYGSKNAQLKTTMEAVELDIIYGRKPVSAWDAAVKDYLDKGGSAIKTELAKAAQSA